MKDNIEYWDKRTKEVGHTGWYDPVIYSFDPKVRLKTIERIRRNERYSNMLDFGGGDGDFSKMASQYSDNVLLYDISAEVIKRAKKKNGHIRNIEYETKWNNITSRKFDCIIAVTVLQHFLNDDDLEDKQRGLKEVLNKNGKLIILEDTFSDEESVDEYTKYRTQKHFEELLFKAGFNFEKTGFYHPLNNPTKDFNDYYRKDRLVMHIRKQFSMKRYRWARFLVKILKRDRKYLFRTNMVEDYIHNASEQDISCIYVCR